MCKFVHVSTKSAWKHAISINFIRERTNATLFGSRRVPNNMQFLQGIFQHLGMVRDIFRDTPTYKQVQNCWLMSQKVFLQDCACKHLIMNHPPSLSGPRLLALKTISLDKVSVEVSISITWADRRPHQRVMISNAVGTPKMATLVLAGNDPWHPMTKGKDTQKWPH